MLLFVVSVPFIVLLANCKQIFVCGNNDISKYVATYWQQLLRNEQALNATLPKTSKQQQLRDSLTRAFALHSCSKELFRGFPLLIKIVVAAICGLRAWHLFLLLQFLCPFHIS